MSDELLFYTHPMSRGRMVRWMLEELGVPYETHLMTYGPDMKTDAYRALNPMGKVPAIRHGEAVVTECAAIIAYLADAFPSAGLAPATGDKRRAAFYRWMFFAAGPVEAAVTNRSLGVVVPPERTGMVGYGSYEAVLDTLEHAVSQNDYLLGGTFSAADVYVGSHIGWGMMFGSIEKRSSFENYWQRIAMRPAAVAARAIDDAILADAASKQAPGAR